MIGCILTGHGSFAPGLAGAAEMIAGPQENFAVVPFTPEMNAKEFENSLKENISSLQEQCDSVLVLTDLLGGTPFKTAMLLTQNLENVEVTAGTNLPIILEFLGSRTFQNDLILLIEQLMDTGKQGIVHMNLNAPEEEETDIDGI